MHIPRLTQQWPAHLTSLLSQQLSASMELVSTLAALCLWAMFHAPALASLQPWSPAPFLPPLSLESRLLWSHAEACRPSAIHRWLCPLRSAGWLHLRLSRLQVVTPCRSLVQASHRLVARPWWTTLPAQALHMCLLRCWSVLHQQLQLAPTWYLFPAATFSQLTRQLQSMGQQTPHLQSHTCQQPCHSSQMVASPSRSTALTSQLAAL